MANERNFIAPGIDVDHLAVHLTNWLDSEGFESQKMLDNKIVVVQVRKKGAWRSALGMTSALTIKMQSAARNLKVEMGAATWADKAMIGTIGALVFWPLLVTTAYGSWDQVKLPKRIFGEIEQYVNVWNARPAMSPAVQSSSVAVAESLRECPNCHKEIISSANFCEYCGQKTEFS